MKYDRTYKNILIALFLLLGFFAYREFLQVNILAYVGQQHIWDSRRFIAFLVFSILSLVFYIMSMRKLLNSSPFMPSIKNLLLRCPFWIRLLIVGLLTSLPAFIIWFAPLPDTIDFGFYSSAFIILSASIIATWVITDNKSNLKSTLLSIGTYCLVGGTAFAACAKLVFVTDYPFPLYWSEGNRFFDYSVLFGAFRYNFPKSTEIYAFSSWGMQLPWALPFLIPNLGIGTFRFWYQLMWILPSIIFGISVYRTFSREKSFNINAIIFGLWAFLFLDQGPIYTPLIIAGIITMIGLRFRLLPAAFIVILASFYAYESRWTWSFAPGLWAGMVALLLIPDFSLRKEKSKEFVRPITLGLAGLFGGRILPDLVPLVSSFITKVNTNISGPSVPVPVGTTSDIVLPPLDVLPNIVNSATKQPLLWERLFPNPTYPPGILLGIAWASLPIIILLVVIAVKKIWHPHWVQAISIFFIAGAFFAVGLTASVKIGGGSNLHNLDMYLITLVIACAAGIIHFWPKENDESSAGFCVILLTVIVMIFPISYALQPSQKPHIPNAQAVENSLAAIRKNINALESNEEVLFIDHRQLLTFNIIPQVPLVDEYEKKKLMDEAMGADAGYFAPFYEDIRNQRFALIINEPLNVIIRGEDYSFGDENDAYVKWVTLPLTCGYKAVFTNTETGVELLVPRSDRIPENLTFCKEFLNPQ
jgi:hypothetical protein